MCIRDSRADDAQGRAVPGGGQRARVAVREYHRLLLQDQLGSVGADGPARRQVVPVDLESAPLQIIYDALLVATADVPDPPHLAQRPTKVDSCRPVSYTHLTLPTILRV